MAGVINIDYFIYGRSYKHFMEDTFEIGKKYYFLGLRVLKGGF